MSSAIVWGVLLQGACLLQIRWSVFTTKRMPSANKMKCFCNKAHAFCKYGRVLYYIAQPFASKVECFCNKAHALCKYGEVLLLQGACLLRIKWRAFATRHLSSALVWGAFAIKRMLLQIKWSAFAARYIPSAIRWETFATRRCLLQVR